MKVEGLEYKPALDRYVDIMNGVKPTGIKVSGKVVVRNEGSLSLQIYRREYLDDMFKWDGYLSDRGITEKVCRNNECWVWTLNGIRHILINYGQRDDIISHYKIFTYRGEAKTTLTRGYSTLYPWTNLKYRDIVLCEGEYDCLSVIAAGYHGITNTAGASTLKEEWGWALSKKNIFIIYDNDLAGNNGRDRVIGMLLS